MFNRRDLVREHLGIGIASFRIFHGVKHENVDENSGNCPIVVCWICFYVQFNPNLRITIKSAQFQLIVLPRQWVFLDTLEWNRQFMGILQ